MEVGSDLGNDSTIQEKTMEEESLAAVCRYPEINRAIKEGKPIAIIMQFVPMRTLELMRKRNLLLYPATSEKFLEPASSGKRRRVEQDLNETAEEMVLPFTKKFDEWKEYESDELYNRTPQRPHFRPLAYTFEPLRENVALCLTQCYCSALKKLDDLDRDVSVSTLDDFKEAFDLLEDHGFDVKAPLSRINELYSVKKGLAKNNISEEQKGSEKEMTDESTKEPKPASFEDKETVKYVTWEETKKKPKRVRRKKEESL